MMLISGAERARRQWEHLMTRAGLKTETVFVYDVEAAQSVMVCKRMD